jgi:hypothetical protein
MARKTRRGVRTISADLQSGEGNRKRMSESKTEPFIVVAIPISLARKSWERFVANWPAIKEALGKNAFQEKK